MDWTKKIKTAAAYVNVNKRKSSTVGNNRHGDGQPSFVASGLLTLIKFYQGYLSPAHPACCRFTPTCSAYALDAVRIHGAVKGGGLALWRILRCQPLCKGGYD
ncbi:MAG: membrane protein insertion efficiency factor YidD, partial [Clostridiaceae bacterium]|nr:membrane protein insertion efficiency factor YidD [Clostridiaceae bacterium]